MDKKAEGWISGFIGVAIFAGSLPATRVAVLDLSPVSDWSQGVYCCNSRSPGSGSPASAVAATR